MNKLGFSNLNDRNIEMKRFLNYDNTELNVLNQNKKSIKYVEPRPNIFFSPIPDNRDIILKEMKKELEKNLEVKIQYRN
jgi:hypothetical protein